MSETAAYTPPSMPPSPLTLESLAKLNEYDETARTLERLIANGELADYDDEIANRVKDAIKIVRGVTILATAKQVRQMERPTIAELEKILQEPDTTVEIRPDGSVWERK